MSSCVCVRVCTRLYNTHIYGLRLLLTYCMDFFPVPCSSIRGDPEIGDHFSSISCSNPWGRMSSKGSFAFWESCLSACFFFVSPFSNLLLNLVVVYLLGSFLLKCRNTHAERGLVNHLTQFLLTLPFYKLFWCSFLVFGRTQLMAVTIHSIHCCMRWCIVLQFELYA
mgnify:CR=1 FL=1